MLIAEISNCHFGNYKKSKDLVKAAFDHGADLVKAQAFLPIDLVMGSKPLKFYKEVSLTPRQYKSLINYANKIKKDSFFYSIFSPELQYLREHTQFHKISAWQTANMSQDWLYKHADDNTFISINQNLLLQSDNLDYKADLNSDIYHYPDIRRGKIMYATDYMQAPQWSFIIDLRIKYWQNIGLSDHSRGIDNSLKAIEEYNVTTIEKHFTLVRDSSYRDSILALSKGELEKLAKRLGK